MTLVAELETIGNLIESYENDNLTEFKVSPAVFL